MSKLLEALENTGAGVKEALERFIQDEELYESCLVTFSQDPGFAALKKAVAEQEYQTAFDQAHTLKGVAGNLGLNTMFRALSQIVEALRAKDYQNLEAQLAEVMAAYDAFNALIKNTAAK